MTFQLRIKFQKQINNEIHSNNDKNLFFSNKSFQKKLSLPTSSVQLNNIKENQIVTEILMQDAIHKQNENFTISDLENKKKIIFNFLKIKNWLIKVIFILIQDQESENLLENQHEFFYESLLSQETFSQDKLMC